MPRAFNEVEEKLIRKSLRETGRKLFEKRGISKTSIEEITKASLISKGSFYKFYASKEILFFELLEEAQDKVRSPLTEPVNGKATRIEFEKRITDLIKHIRHEPLLKFLADSHELRKIARKIPHEKLSEHQERDRQFLTRLIDQWNHKPEPPVREVVAAHMGLLLLIQHSDTILGDRLYPFAEGAIVTSFVNCLFD